METQKVNLNRPSRPSRPLGGPSRRHHAGIHNAGYASGPYDDSVAPYDGIATIHNPEAPTVSPYIQIQPRRPGPPKEVKTAYKMGILGFLGLHHFYLGRPKFGVLYLFTGGLLLTGWLMDLCRMPFLVKQANDMIDHPEKYRNKRTTLDAYVLWFPLGLIGAHHYYLGRMYWGVAYTFTLGILGIGWLIDGVRMKQLVKETNESLQRDRSQELDDSDEKRLSECYILAVSPLGLLGAHHYYLERWMFGVIYTFTCGLLGVGWLVDLCTLPYVFEHANKIRRHEKDPDKRYLAEAYKLIFPCGFLGLHHFYLRRPGWGVLYLFTFGVIGIGWIVDFFRLPTLVRKTNLATEREAANLTELQNRLSHGQQLPPPNELPPIPPPPQYSPRPSRRHSSHPHSIDRSRIERMPIQQAAPGTFAPQNDPGDPPPYTPRATPHPKPVTSQAMDVITEEDEDAVSVISSVSRQTAAANDVFLENALNESLEVATDSFATTEL